MLICILINNFTNNSNFIFHFLHFLSILTMFVGFCFHKFETIVEATFVKLKGGNTYALSY